MEPKKVTDSLTEQIHVVIYPDINGFGRLFGGQLLKWIDEVAGATARRHCGNNATTAAIDNLQFKAGAFINDVLVLTGRVTYVGKTPWRYGLTLIKRTRTAPVIPLTVRISSWSTWERTASPRKRRPFC